MKSAVTFSEWPLILVLVFLVFAIPAYANNPPQPDGLFSALLIFPVVLLGIRLAGLVLKPKGLVTRIITWMAVAICSFFFLAAGTIVGAVAVLLILIYAVVRAVQIMQKGQSAKRLWIGLVVMVFSVFAFFDYYLSIARGHLSTFTYERIAELNLRNLSEAQQEFAKTGQHSARGRPTFATMQDLKAANLIRETFADEQTVKGYRFGEVLDADREHYLFYATPAPGLKPGDESVEIVPGTALLKSLFGRDDEGTGRKSFAVDETGQVREAIRSTGDPVTREEVAQWKPLQ